MKVFDCKEIPSGLLDRKIEELELNNCSYFKIKIADDLIVDPLENWLIKNGARDSEEVLIYWWW